MKIRWIRTLVKYSIVVAVVMCMWFEESWEKIAQKKKPEISSID